MRPKTSYRLSAAVIVAAVVLSSTSAVEQGSGVPAAFVSAPGANSLADGAPQDYDAIAGALHAATASLTEAGNYLLPPGTTTDSVAWDGNVMVIHLTIPFETSDWWLSPLDMETLGLVMGSPYRDDPAFGGTRVRARVGVDQPYDTLEQFLLVPPYSPADVQPSIDETEGALSDRPATSMGGETAFGGPTANAARQPTGALSGVVVYASAGHGWTANDTRWYLQRPVLLDMAEDYGNIDQLNYFVHYAFNAGATVVPMRPVGWQPIEIVLDNDDAGVTYAGAWSDSTAAKYYENGTVLSGVSYRYSTANVTETATARYTPTIAVTDFYPVYCFALASTNRTLQTYRVSHSGGISEITIDHRDVGSGWIWLGDYYCEAGGDNYVEITNMSPEAGVVVADAIRWGGGIGDIVRPGPGTISGYPRDEECQRYWAHSEFGNNAAGFDSGIWDIPGSSDGSDNVGTGARVAREMNQVPAGGVQVDRWKRIHLEFHTNASGGTARGQICLITDLGATTYQAQFATTLADEVDADLLLIDDEFEHQWIDRTSSTYTSSYGAIATSNNSNEFDATIVELAFHDNQDDAELLRDCRVRSAMARACVHGIIRFLNTLPDSQVPLDFAPDTPRNVRVEDLGGGDVRISWQAPLVDGARGDAATGYVVYQSSNGYGFGDPVILGDVLTTTISGVAVGETRYFRVAATNDGGESMPSEVLAVRRPTEGTANVLIVNGFDRLRRQINPIQTFTQPVEYAGDWIERQMWREANAFDYVVEHAEALAANNFAFAMCSNDAAIASAVNLGDYDVVVWILGTESTEDVTFTAFEQTLVSDFLNDGGALFVTGSEIVWDLVANGAGSSFAQDTLRVGYSGDDADSYLVSGAAGSILSDMGSFDFDPANGAAYDATSPDRLAVGTDAVACLNYLGGSGGVAGVQYTGPIYNTVVFGFPFETISSPTVRADVMQRVVDFLETAIGPLPFDKDRDNDVDFTDFAWFVFCFHGPDDTYTAGHLCHDLDGDGDADVDVQDYAAMQEVFTGP